MEKLILFFNGWGMDENPLSHLIADDFEIKIISDYCTFSTNTIKEIPLYKEVYLVAWSMGVWEANSIFQLIQKRLTKSIAINGTTAPLDNTLGIPRATFQATYDNFDERTREKFFLRMCGGKEVYDVFKKQAPMRTVESQKEELKYFLDNATDDRPFEWSTVIIGSGDKIFPFENLQAAWAKHQNVHIIDAPHYPFYLWKSWSEIIIIG